MGFTKKATTTRATAVTATDSLLVVGAVLCGWVDASIVEDGAVGEFTWVWPGLVTELSGWSDTLSEPSFEGTGELS